ncbi:hypothetical protein LTR02_002922 [Friedmanniomyces endolithicus]|nr:hypothetical protein LTR94_002820 [Friedmanniomyces endolithicus]KAK0800205.1 hypothetical protein LTR75_008999 [Friedmanniomyces endolithicus]KAK0805678.1 hypothetical protein LTR59_003900 [Friedmanniomyces endolithicus]KAK0809831.1 hypothetical protein LTR38_004161 [Friedmanniomyces endolithicus]KAK0848894.1 hypothetical protein LTR03_005459 [Friedmanniomyces endolithicus]
MAETTTTTTTTRHPLIGEVKGIIRTDEGVTPHQGVRQYLGIQYATLKDRFAPAVLREYDGKTSVDATTIGPQTAPLPEGAEHEQDLIQHRLSSTGPIEFSDTEALNLNITYPVPTNREDFVWQSDNLLPVFLFVHGGGFQVGSASFPQYDMARFVRLSYQKGRPIIAVTVNYRLGPPGLLNSREMREEGYLANNCLRDQRVAIEWVRKFIGGFGGDSENITLAGESAGAISCSYHLQSKVPLFRRVMLMSGTNLLIPPLPLEVAEQSFASAVKALGLEEKSVGERMERLRSIDAADLRGKLMMIPMLPVVDDELPVAGHSFADFHAGTSGGTVDIAGAKWCESMMIGDCAFDGNIQGLRLGHRKKGIGKAFCDAVKSSSLNPEQAETLLKGYDMTPDLDEETAFERVLQTLNDIGFYAPTLAFAEGLRSRMKTYVYRFNEPNPWAGPWQGRTNHILDIAFFLQNFNEFLDDAQRSTAEAFAVSVFKFVTGEVPWKASRNEGHGKVAMVMGPQGKGEVVEDVPGETGRRAILLDLAEEVEGGMDRLGEVLNAFLRGPPAS